MQTSQGRHRDFERFYKIRMVQPNIIKTGFNTFENISNEPVYVEELGVHVRPGRWDVIEFHGIGEVELEWFPENSYVSEYEFNYEICAEVKKQTLLALRKNFGRKAISINCMFEAMLQNFAEVGKFFTEEQGKNLKNLMHQVANYDPQVYGGSIG